MKRALSALALLLLPLAALADGKVFPPIALPANVTIPDQRALIQYTNGIERLVIETRFTGTGTNFAWVVPLPSQPVIEEASTGLFPTLQYLFRPQIVHDVPRYYVALVALIWIGYLLVFVRPTGRMTWMDVAACASVAGCASLAVREFPVGASFGVFCVLMLAVALVRLRKEPVHAVLGLVAVIFFLPTMLLPSLGKSRAGLASSTSPGQMVSILDRQLVGVFETTTIASREAKALQTWLRENGFALPTNTEPVIADYVKAGWVFVAAKVRRDKADRETSTPHPLSFSFKTEKPVYPMRLTGVDNGPLEIELYVFGSSRASALHFKAERCTRPDYPKPPPNDSWSWNWLRRSPETPNIVHPLLRRWVGGSAVATKLTATLSPSDMRQDVLLEWLPYSEKRSRQFSRAGAWTYSLNLGAGALAVSLLFLCFFEFSRTDRARHMSRMAAGVLTFSIAISGATYLVLPRVEVRLVKQRFLSTGYDALFYLSEWLHEENAVTRAEIRTEAQRVLADPTNNIPWLKARGGVGEKGWENFLVGGMIHEEDSPGNYTLRENGDSLEFVAYDAQGAEHVMPGTWKLRPLP